MKQILLILFYLLSSTLCATDALPLDNKEKQKRYYTLIEEIRCPVCQGQSIGGSNAPLAKDLREQVIKMLNNNKSDKEIKNFMTARYGDFVSFKPPVNRQTYLLWALPFLLLALAVFILFKSIRQKHKTTTTKQ